MTTKIEISLGNRDLTGMAATRDECESAILAAVHEMHYGADVTVSTRADDGHDVVTYDGDARHPVAQLIRDSISGWEWEAEEKALAKKAE